MMTTSKLAHISDVAHSRAMTTDSKLAHICDVAHSRAMMTASKLAHSSVTNKPYIISGLKAPGKKDILHGGGVVCRGLKQGGTKDKRPSYVGDNHMWQIRVVFPAPNTQSCTYIKVHGQSG